MFKRTSIIIIILSLWFLFCAEVFASDSCKRIFENRKRLIEVMEKGDIKEVETLLNKGDKLGWMALEWAVENRRAEIVKLLIDKGALRIKDFESYRSFSTALRLASRDEDREIFDLLRSAERED